MSSVVVLQRLTTGTEAQRLLDELTTALAVPFDDLTEVRQLRFAAVDDAAARTAVERELEAISLTWSIHLRILDP